MNARPLANDLMWKQKHGGNENIQNFFQGSRLWEDVCLGRRLTGIRRLRDNAERLVEDRQRMEPEHAEIASGGSPQARRTDETGPARKWICACNFVTDRFTNIADMEKLELITLCMEVCPDPWDQSQPLA